MVRHWDVASAKELRRLAGHQFSEDSHKRIYGCACSPDGKFVAFGGQPNYIALYDMATGKETKRLTGLPGGASSLVFSADSRTLACGDWDGTVHVWEVATGQQIHQFAGHQGRVFGLAFSLDGCLLLTGSADTTVLVWDAFGRRTNAATEPASDKDIETGWADLAGEDAIRAQRAIRILASAPKKAVPFLENHLQPADPIDVKRIAALLIDLDSDTFAVRENAYLELEKLGAGAEMPFREALGGSPSSEVRHRLEQLLEKLNRTYSSPRRRMLRSLRALEVMATQDSQKLLERLARGAPEGLLSQEARAALDRMKRQKEKTGRE